MGEMTDPDKANLIFCNIVSNLRHSFYEQSRNTLNNLLEGLTPDERERFIDKMIELANHEPSAVINFLRMLKSGKSPELYKLCKSLIQHPDIEIRDEVASLLECMRTKQALTIIEDAIENEKVIWFRIYLEKVAHEFRKELGDTNGQIQRGNQVR